jgi:hypothetical protein
MKCVDEIRNGDLLIEAFEAGQLLQRGGHEAHVVGGGSAVVERPGGDRVGQRLVQLVQALRERLLRLLRRLLQVADPQHLLIRQRVQLRYQYLHSQETRGLISMCADCCLSGRARTDASASTWMDGP